MQGNVRDGLRLVSDGPFFGGDSSVKEDHAAADRRTWRAAAELHLDLMYALTRFLQCDADSVWVVMCVVEHALRARETPGAAAGISRRMIADKTGLARETVRRRVTALVRKGLLIEDPVLGGVLPRAFDAAPGFSEMLADIERTVRGFTRRVSDTA